MIDAERIAHQIEELGASHAAYIKTKQIPFEKAFRAACEQNACGFYNRCWTCPPDAGSIDACIALVQSFPHAILFQTISPLEDSYDIDGMHNASVAHNRLTLDVQKAFRQPDHGSMVLGAGACGVCPTCTKPEGNPCRFPDLAITSLEACGVNVSELARICGLRYINGQNTVTFFGLLLYIDPFV
jgi:predicted metal-binding protein